MATGKTFPKCTVQLKVTIIGTAWWANILFEHFIWLGTYVYDIINDVALCEQMPTCVASVLLRMLPPESRNLYTVILRLASLMRSETELVC